MPFPKKLLSIVPELKQWEADQQKAYDDFTQQTQTIALQNAQSLEALQRKT